MTRPPYFAWVAAPQHSSGLTDGDEKGGKNQFVCSSLPPMTLRKSLVGASVDVSQSSSVPAVIRPSPSLPTEEDSPAFSRRPTQQGLKTGVTSTDREHPAWPTLP